jgi:predicted MPP superfamily phosphohydrolase
MHKLLDQQAITTKIFKSVIENITSFQVKPAFIVITGDLVEWGGSDISGALNYRAFVECLYEKDKQLYADADYTIPVYTTPGNHDYNFNRNLKNYHRFIDGNHVKDKDRYIVTFGDLSLFFLDSGPNHYDEPDDWFDFLGDGLYNCSIEWLENALKNCSSKHRVVLMHHPAVNYRNEYGEMFDVIARNREVFLELCETYNVDLVLAGHTHDAVVFDKDENVYEELSLNCSDYPMTLHVQSDDCKQGCHYRNITIKGDDIWIEESVELDITALKYDNYEVCYRLSLLVPGTANRNQVS